MIKTIKTTRIFKVIAVCAAMLLPTMNAQAQKLVEEQQRGTIFEQVEKARATQANVQELLNLAYTFRGVPYRYGQASPSGFDCSGFTSYVFKQFGIKLDRTAGGQMNNGERVARADLKPGDLVFFTGRAITSRIGHVGIVTQVNSDNTFNFIHAASRGITVSNINESYYKCRYMGACRVLQ